jgi:chromosome partitioning protein
VPVLPSDIDIHAAAKCISDLLLTAKIRREEQRIAVIANRVKKNTLVYKALMKFLETLNIPVVATLRDSQNYIRAAEMGVGLFEMKPNQVREDMEQWLPLIGWLAQRKPLYIAPGTPAITSAASVNSLPAAAPLPGAVANPGVNPLAASAVGPPAATPAATETDPAPVPPAAPTIG